jgi:hypothetical protein
MQFFWQLAEALHLQLDGTVLFGDHKRNNYDHLNVTRLEDVEAFKLQSLLPSKSL